MPPLIMALGPETSRIRVPSQCELPRSSNHRCESWWPPPLSRVPQSVSIQPRPVSECWRALVVSYIYCGVCDDWRGSPRPNRGTTRLVQSAQKSRNQVTRSQHVTRWKLFERGGLRKRRFFQFGVVCQ